MFFFSFPLEDLVEESENNLFEAEWISGSRPKYKLFHENPFFRQSNPLH